MLPVRAVFVILLLTGSARVNAQESGVLSGVVLSATTGAPVAAAGIHVEALGRSVMSDEDGRWRIAIDEGVHEIVVQHIGYATHRVSASPASSPVVVRLTERPLSLGSLVVTASRRTQQLKDVPVATEVIERTELRSSGASDLSAVLVERAGVSLQGGHPVGAGVMLQGLGSERVLILLDGQPLQGRIAGTLDLARIAVSTVERVEVVKGPQSTLYGSDAMGGVINIITRAPDRDTYRFGVDVTGGSRDRLDVSANGGGGAGAFAWTADGGRRSIDLVPGHAGEAATFSTRYDGATRGEWRPDSSVTVFAAATLLDEAQRWRTGALYSFADNTQWTARTGVHVSRGAHTLTPTLYVTEFRHLSRRSTLPQAVEGSGESERQRLLEAELLYAGSIGALDLDAGIEARRESIRSDRVVAGVRSLYTIEPFVQATLGGERWSVVPGLRHSWSEQWGAHVTPRIATMFRPVPALALRASVGRGFRAPAFKELHMEFLNTGAGAGYRVRGNPLLQPETSRNVSGSAEWSGERTYVRAQLFYNRFDDFIETVELPDSNGLRVFTYGNIDDGVTYGSELDIGATWRTLRAEAGYAWLIAEDRSTGRTLPGRPAHSLRGSLTWARPGGLRATLTGTHTGRTLVTTTDSVPLTRPAFSRVDARLSHSLPYGVEVRFGVDNIAGVQPEQWPGFVTRQFHLGLGWNTERSRR